MTKQYTWYLLAQELSELDFNKEGLAEVVVAEKTLCVAMHQDKVFACAAICPHAAHPLVTGYVNVKNHIVCPLHQYKFSLQNGRNVSGEGYFLKTYPVEKRTDGWYVGLY
ncbi:MAG TPA: Rieske (2Fe-2S) protein [Niabella sp.]|nr:Rieske (2Fe-2S) protein [Niabella sp.]HOZ96168.1 Rieske (2Fe-2S) protein [Niabella sp.]HQW13533.1 Rieske (2Fe-2S) protein [Niabella sp.]HQX18927.1 Rieske (2Fe-2S) protein [Niabella sp.]HQX40432.1 Rieske (2Fe-2S) protein [Niabella sp.]